MQEQVRADFDPDKFGSVFSMLDSSQLAWLEGLAADPAGRQLIYQLSASHRSCLLLNFAIQKILYAGTLHGPKHRVCHEVWWPCGEDAL